MISKHLFVLLAGWFIVMIGLGITMPVLPFYLERLALAERVSRWSGNSGSRLFEATFALYAQAMFNYGPVEVGKPPRRSSARCTDCRQLARSAERGPLLGSALLLWHRDAPYLMTETLLVVVSVLIGWIARVRERLTVRQPAARKRGA